ncbi:hypothetical protein LB523_06525 [Mesorhizobium sp. ESP-6-4]|uniref:hypothetical protein n=1 Tax=unclassified Mesorhizobium TaxID=325217 RepID=UPI001CCD9F6F|nr:MULTISPECIES: hypothetical protein [unclassified Mesorhizobium]MBZ9658694.1 hypothetical protein [Mesorhizobium sp. ESP-6-4]MBZ9868693.1 hypothetical protein [Mesorhizobium sp. CA15]
MSETDQRVVAGQASGLMRDGLQLGELIGAAGEETLAEGSEGVGWDGQCSGVVEAVLKQKEGWSGMVLGLRFSYMFNSQRYQPASSLRPPRSEKILNQDNVGRCEVH